MRTVGKEIGARYVMEGSLRQAGSMLRVAVQLVDASLRRAPVGGDLQPPVQPRRDLRAAGRPRAPHRVDGRRLVRRPAAQHERVGPEQAARRAEPVRGGAARFRLLRARHSRRARGVRAALERAVEQAPGYADCLGHAVDDVRGGAQVPLQRACPIRWAARSRPHGGRSTPHPSNHFAHLALAQAFFFRKEFPAFRSAAERAIALNPMDGSTCEYWAT